MLDRDPDQMNTDPKHCLLVEAIGVEQSGLTLDHISKYLRYIVPGFLMTKNGKILFVKIIPFLLLSKNAIYRYQNICDTVFPGFG
jgi:hypothetical protein